MNKWEAIFNKLKEEDTKGNIDWRMPNLFKEKNIAANNVLKGVKL